MSVRKGIVLVVDGRYLLLKHKQDGSYSFISGGLKEGEGHTDGVIREARLETGLKIDEEKIIETNEKVSFVGATKGPSAQSVLTTELYA